MKLPSVTTAFASSALFFRRRHRLLLHTRTHLAHAPCRELRLERRCHPFDESLRGFYRANFHERRNKKWVPSLPTKDGGSLCDNDDAMYVLRDSQDDEMLAALRLTRSKNDEQYIFLRSLCVSREQRRNGLASRLMQQSMRDFGGYHYYCFASLQLKGLYQQAGFERISTGEIDSLPKWLTASYRSMDARWNSKDSGELGLFVQHDASPDTTQIVLLQHVSESSKKTATGWLIDDGLYSNAFPDCGNGHQQLNLQLRRWIWAGRNDATKIETRLDRLTKQRRSIHLLWTDATAAGCDNDGKNYSSNNPQQPLPGTYIILDGTWQQAKQMYRRCPGLWKLPRVSLQNAPPSKFSLRGNYGWKEKFGMDNVDDDQLLCTAEVAAAVMDRCGESDSAHAIRKRLDVFQDSILPRRKRENHS